MLEDRGDQARFALTAERRFARDHLVQHQPEGKEIAARVRLPAVEQLRRHVLDRAEDLPLLGHLPECRFLWQ